MKALVLKSFKSNGVSYEKDTIIDVPVSVFHKLSLKGLVKYYLPHISEKEIPLLITEFKHLFNEHAENLKKIPVASTYIKEHYPDIYELLKKLSDLLDEAFLTFNREMFIKTAREIESIVWACYIGDTELIEQKTQKPREIELNRGCINCGCTRWLIFKPKSKVSSIKCLSCGNFELFVRSNGER